MLRLFRAPAGSRSSDRPDVADPIQSDRAPPG
ncbi:MAG: hypothetical protein JWL81_429 [Verrucomicrobiales bacterium]|nr:hypothetical protein [Verrucomicrobiales bacterium]